MHFQFQYITKNFYQFGMAMESYPNAELSYAYDFNGKETDSETGLQDYGFGIYNKSYGKFLSVDPLHRDYPYYSSYHYAANTTIWTIDIDGLEPWMLSETNTMSKSGYREHLGIKLTTFIKNNNYFNIETDCAEFQFYLLMTYYAESSQRLVFTGKNEHIYDSHAVDKKGYYKYKSADHFFKKARYGVSSRFFIIVEMV